LGAYPRSRETLEQHIESTLIICIQLLSTIEENYEQLMNAALDACHELHDAGKLKELLR
jgi:5-bromo-4-chloroindolyl phosphate hydrolysis protein